MIIFRALQESDLPALKLLTNKHEFGVTTLPHDEPQLRISLNQAVMSFHSPSETQERYYWFILEEAETHIPIGVSAIATQVGLTKPACVFKRVPIHRYCKSLNITHDDEELVLSFDLKGSSELCTLYLRPDYRKAGLGQFLSRARFLFLGQFQHYFTSHLIAEMRGVSSETGHSPFWNAVGQHFFHMPFTKAESLILKTDKQFITDLIPTDPLYVSLLPKKAQMVIGKPHPNTEAAMHILFKEGFYALNYINIFDAGPVLEARLARIHSIQHANCLPAQLVTTSFSGQPALLSNTHFSQFRATRANVQLNENKDALIVSKEIAMNLQIGAGEPIRFILD
jgi:arginine N-succinyltransferase